MLLRKLGIVKDYDSEEIIRDAEQEMVVTEKECVKWEPHIWLA